MKESLPPRAVSVFEVFYSAKDIRTEITGYAKRE